MKRKICTCLIIIAFFLPATAVIAGGNAEPDADITQLTMGSWRTDDVEQINAVLDAFHAEHPDIKIKFQPTNPPDYNATLRLQLENGTGPDLFYARSYATGVQLFNEGYLQDLSGLADLAANYSEGNRSPWTTPAGNQFAVPFVAVSHGIYYNKDIFAEHNVSIPETWAQFLTVCETLSQAGVIPVANSLGDEWDIAEVVFMSLAPNFIGGREGRLAYERGERKFNDQHVVAAFQAMQDLTPYLPDGFEALTYNDSNVLFATQQAAMLFDGSWTIGTFKDVDFSWSVFAVPPPAGSPGYVCFHADAGMAINAASEHQEAAELFISWLGSKAGAEVLANSLPTGFFPMSEQAVEIQDEHANAFLALNKDRDTDVRWPWPELFNGEPSGYELMMYGSIAVITGRKTPQQAADDLQNGLAKWYKPAQ